VRVERHFDVKLPREAALARAARDEVLVSLFPEGRVEIVAREGARRTLRTHYRALGREGTATFHFHFEPGGEVRFEKVCDGRIWRELAGRVSFATRGKGTRVTISAEGRTKALVPELAIRGPMQEQIEAMARALRRCIEGGSGA
jgi:hypothetical protein